MGFAAAPAQVGAVTFDLRPESAAAAVTARDGKPFAESGHLLIAATARAESLGMVYQSAKRSATDPGHAPILMEPMRGRVRNAMSRAARAATGYPLDSVDERVRHADVAKEGKGIDVALTANAFW